MREAIELEVPVTSPDLAAIRAFVAVLIANGGGHIVTVLYLLSLASTPPIAGYSASKAAAHSLTQELRPVLAAQGISVHGVHPDGSDRHRHLRRRRRADADRRGSGEPSRRSRRRSRRYLPRPDAAAMAGPLPGRPEGVQARFCGAVAA